MLSDFVDSLTRFMESLVLTFGVPGIAVIAFLENIFPPTPSEFLYPLAGKLAYDGEANLVAVILAGVLGSLVGAFVFYHVGALLGAERVRGLIDRYGTVRLWRLRFTVFSVEDYDRAEALFMQRGGMIVMIARWIPLVHGVISIPAGVVGMNLAKFMVYSFLGIISWIAPTVLAGYFLGSQWEQVLSLLDTYSLVWYALMGAGVLYYALHKYRQRKQVPE